MVKIQSSLQKSIQQTLNYTVAKMISNVGTPRPTKKNFLERRTNKKIIETEPVESFHRRDNARIFGLSQKTEGSGTLSEPSETSMRNLVDNANLISASITANDIYIAHSHLHYMGCQRSRVGTESMVVIFVGRIGKINLLKNKKELAKN